MFNIRVPFSKSFLFAGIVAALLFSPESSSVTLTLQDDFSNAAATESRWGQGFVNGQDSEWTVVSGAFRGTSTTRGIFAGLDKTHPCAIQGGIGDGFLLYRNTNLTLSFDMRFITYPSFIGAGAIILAPERPAGTSSFFVSISDFGAGPNISLGIVQNGDPLNDIPLGTSFFPAGYDVFQWHHVEIVLIGGVVTATVDGATSVSAPVPASIPLDPTFGGPGGSALVMGRGLVNFALTVDFDNFSITGDVVCSVIEATVDAVPDRINTRGKGKWINVFLTLPSGFDVADIVPSSIVISGLNGTDCNPDYTQLVDLSFTPVIGDHDEDGIPDLHVRFDRQVLQANLCIDDVGLVIEGDLIDGDHFIGQDSITVFEPGNPNN